MKKILISAVILSLSVSLAGCMDGRRETQIKEGKSNSMVRELVAGEKSGAQVKDEPKQTDKSDEDAVANLVEDFGKNLQKVSLLAPKDLVSESMQENYGTFVSPALLAEWRDDPQKAPGRMFSSPWPDRIEIGSVKKLAADAYEVKGEIIEITSVEKVSGGAAAKQAVSLVVKKINNRWLIDAVTLGDYKKDVFIACKNPQ